MIAVTCDAAIVGGGFCGLAAAYELTRRGFRVAVFEAQSSVGGLAGSFKVGEAELEMFYHHWFLSDQYILDIVKELGHADKVMYRPSSMGVYYLNRVSRLSSLLDLIRFKQLSLGARIRLIWMALQARRVKDWSAYDAVPASEWLLATCGREAYEVLWQPLLRGKFGKFAEQVSAAWFGSKLRLRGGSRKGVGREHLAYYEGGFIALARDVCAFIESRGGLVYTGERVEELSAAQGRIHGLRTQSIECVCQAALVTTPLPIFADLVRPHCPESYVRSLNNIRFLANICLVLELSRSLSDSYWLNVNDPTFPFVGIIEHTNFVGTGEFAGRHIVYLSKYLPIEDRLYSMSDEEVAHFALPYLSKVFPQFDSEWILDFHVWRADHAQPVVTVSYADLIPTEVTPIDGLFLATMAQIYPEDRGTNFAVRNGRAVCEKIVDFLMCQATG